VEESSAVESGANEPSGAVESARALSVVEESMLVPDSESGAEESSAVESGAAVPSAVESGTAVPSAFASGEVEPSAVDALDDDDDESTGASLAPSTEGGGEKLSSPSQPATKLAATPRQAANVTRRNVDKQWLMTTPLPFEATIEVAQIYVTKKRSRV